MNENHAHDKDLLEKVERLLHSGQASGDDLLDTLAATQPRARADFQQTLEEQLVATLQTQQSGLPVEENMTTHPALAAPKRHRNFRLPVTLAAALVVMIAAISLFASIRPPVQFAFVAQASTDTPVPTPTHVPTATPNALSLTATAIVADGTQTALTPAEGITHLERSTQADMMRDFQPILIARDTIRRGTQITAEMLATAYLPVDIDLQQLFGSSRGVVSAFDGSPEQAAGQYALADIPALMPLLVNDLVADNPIGRLPRNMSYPARVPIDREAAAQFAPGDLLAVFAELAYFDQEQQPHTITRPIVDVAEVLEISDAEDSDQMEVVITMASNNDRLLIMDMVDAGVPLALVKHDRTAASLSSRSPAQQADIPADLQPVVVARFPLQKGTWLTEDALMLVYVPQASVPTPARGDMNGLIGQYLQRDFERWQPILAGDVASRAEMRQVEEITLPDAGWRMSLNEESRARVFIPLVDIPDHLPVGERVAITTQMQFREDDETGLLVAVAPDNQIGRSVAYRILAQPELVEVEAGGLVLSMYATEAVDVIQALEAGLPLKLGYAVDVSMSSTILPEGMGAVSIPLDSTTASAFREGDMVDVQADMLFVEIDEGGSSQSPATGQLATQIATGQTPQLVTQVIVKGAQIIEIGEDIVTLAVSPQDAVVLRWALEAKLPLTLLPHDRE